jgi:uncharacterized protein (DUF983 family)
MRSVLCKCPNYSGCLLAYHCDDIEVGPNSPMVCPECGAALKRAPSARSDALYTIANAVGILAVAGAVWFAWPSIVRLWHKATMPPAKSAPAKR